jgi:hypothetical protein
VMRTHGSNSTMRSISENRMVSSEGYSAWVMCGCVEKNQAI